VGVGDGIESRSRGQANLYDARPQVGVFRSRPPDFECPYVWLDATLQRSGIRPRRVGRERSIPGARMAISSLVSQLRFLECPMHEGIPSATRVPMYI
jgi:hypothetical protein